MRRVFAFALLAVAVGMPGIAATVTVDGTSNIFYAGQASTGGGGQGTLPISSALPVSPTFVTFSSVVGSVEYCDGAIDPVCIVGSGDGTPDVYGVGGTNLALAGSGLSGIQYTGTNMFLIGVFLDASTPSGSGPATLSYTSSSADGASFSPLLNQLFFIGDGQYTGGTQTFFVPTGATRLFLGFADGTPGFTGTVGAYGDNSGFFDVTFDVASTEIPEPGTVALIGLGLVGIGFLRKRV